MQQQEQHIDSKANNAQPKQRKTRRGLRVTLIVLAALIALIVTIVAAVIIWLGPIAERVVERYDKELIGRRIEMSNLRIKLFRGELSVDSLRMFEPNDSTHFVNINRLESSIAVREAFKRHIDITGISLSRPEASVVQRDTVFNFDDIIAFIDTTYLSSEIDTTAVEGEPWRVSIKNIKLEGGRASYLDSVLDQQWVVSSLNILSDSIMLSDAKSLIVANANINERAHLDGTLGINLSSLDFEFDGTLSNFSLADLYKYIVPVLNVSEIEGLLSTDINIEGNASELTAMDIKGALSLDDFQLTGRDGGNLLSAGNLTAHISELNIDKQSYILSSLVASNYSTQFIMHKDGRTNFDGLFYDEPEVSLETTSESVSSNIYDQRERVTITTESSTSPLSGMTLRIGELKLQGGNIFFADRTMTKEFEYSLSNIAIESRGFDIASRNKLTIRANMQRKGTALLRWEGSLNDFYNQSLLASLQNVNMEDFTPYVEHYTAFPVTSGNLTFRSQNTITNGEISGMNRLGTYDFKVGKKDRSMKPEYKIPLRLGVFMLTDKDNHIDVDLPITGNIDSPEFSLRKVIFKAIGKLLLKIVASPFSWMSADKQDTFRAIDFTLLDPTLSSEHYARLDKIAEELKGDETMKVRLEQRVNYQRARREIADLNLKMAFYNSQQTDSDKRLDMLDFVRIQELKLSGKEIAEFADSQLIARGIDPQHLSTHAKAEALYGNIVDMQLSRIMEARNKTIRDYMGFQHKELAPDSFTIESMSMEKMQSYHGKERFGVTLVIDGEEVAMEEQEAEAENESAATAENNNESAAALEQNKVQNSESIAE
ncbi:MAG: DUF748 domain-containing protein [Alistipes sp.]|nr:DUF748 domain-containing protein [Alistipes sp.]